MVLEVVADCAIFAGLQMSYGVLPIYGGTAWIATVIFGFALTGYANQDREIHPRLKKATDWFVVWSVAGVFVGLALGAAMGSVAICAAI